ncbi:hypothetical protein [Marinomonas sp.]|uniref:hypothetical protein n=1 Tax=Marinomonas sp. TaxID=1904862 RepID=UPI003BA97F77
MRNESEIDVLIGKGTKSTYQNLFPYLNVGSFIEVSDFFRANNFFEVPSSVTTTDYYIELEELDKNLNREKMESLSANYINGTKFQKHSFLRYSVQFNDSLQFIFNAPFNENTSARDLIKFLEKNGEVLNVSENQTKSLWLSVFSLIIQIDYELSWLEELFKLLKKINVLKHVNNSINHGIEITEEFLSIWWQASLLLPKSIFPLPDSRLIDQVEVVEDIDNTAENVKGENTENLYDARYYALGTLHLIEYKLVGYKLGELQKVETVLKGETRESCSRELVQDQQQANSKNSNNEINDTQQQLIDKDLNTYVQQILADRSVTTDFKDYKADYAGTSPNATTTGGWTIDEKPARGDERHVEFVKKVLEQTQSKASAAVQKARQTRLTIEKELTITNRFANESDRNTNGFYYWLNKEYEVVASDLRKRLLIEIIFPIQNTELERMLEMQRLHDFSAPETLKQVGLNSYADISTVTADPLYYLTLAEQFSVEEVAVPPQSYSVAKSFKSDQVASSCSFSVEPGYQLNAICVVINCSTAPLFEVTLGGESVPMTKDGHVFTSGSFVPSISGAQLTELSVSVLKKLPSSEEQDISYLANIQQDISYLANIQIDLVAKEDYLNQWKYEVYKALGRGYDKQLAEYHEKLKQLERWLEDHDTPVTRGLINNYIAKQSMRVLYDKAMRRCAGDQSYPNDELPFTQYFENALEWDHLYCKLFELSPDEQDGDSLGITTSPVLSKLDNTLYLKRFLLATKAKVLLPVKENQVLRFLYFLDTGQIWHGAEHLTPVNEQALAIVNDYKKLPYPDRDKEEKNSWTITLPTAMSVLSDDDNLKNIGRHLYGR